MYQKIQFFLFNGVSGIIFQSSVILASVLMLTVGVPYISKREEKRIKNKLKTSISIEQKQLDDRKINLSLPLSTIKKSNSMSGNDGKYIDIFATFMNQRENLELNSIYSVFYQAAKFDSLQFVKPNEIKKAMIYIQVKEITITNSKKKFAKNRYFSGNLIVNTVKSEDLFISSNESEYYISPFPVLQVQN